MPLPAASVIGLRLPCGVPGHLAASTTFLQVMRAVLCERDVDLRFPDVEQTPPDGEAGCRKVKRKELGV